MTHSKTKLTNALLKQILNQPKSRDPTPKSKVKSKTTQLTDIVGKKMINKKDKMGIKKNLWAQSKLKNFFIYLLNLSLLALNMRSSYINPLKRFGV